MRTTSLRPSGRADVTSLPQAGMGGVGWRGVGGRGAEECAGSVRRESRARHAAELPIAARERRTRGDVARAEWPALVAHRQASHRGRVTMVGEGGGGRGGVPANDDGRDDKRPSSAPCHCARCACHFSSAQRENADLHTNEGRAHVGRGGESGSRAERHLNAEVSPRSNALARPRTAATSRDAWPAAQTKEVGRGRHASAFCLNQTKIGAQKPLRT